MRPLAPVHEVRTRHVERSSVFQARVEKHLHFSTHLHFHTHRMKAKVERSSRSTVAPLMFRDRVVRSDLVGSPSNRREVLTARHRSAVRDRWHVRRVPGLNDMPVNGVTPSAMVMRRATLSRTLAPLSRRDAAASTFVGPALLAARRLRRSRAFGADSGLARDSLADMSGPIPLPFTRARTPRRAQAQMIGRGRRDVRDESRAARLAFEARRVELVMRKSLRAAPSPELSPATGSELAHSMQPQQAKRSLPAQSAAPESSQPQLTSAHRSLPKLDPQIVERLAEDVMRRIEKRTRIERERRGLS
jgi:hypothetical protein